MLFRVFGSVVSAPFWRQFLRLAQGHDASQPDSFGTTRFIEVQQSAWQSLRRLPGQRDRGSTTTTTQTRWGNWPGVTGRNQRRLEKIIPRMIGWPGSKNWTFFFSRIEGEIPAAKYLCFYVLEISITHIFKP